MSTPVLGVVMDPIDSIKPYKDTTLALLLAARRHGWSLRYLEQGDLFLADGRAMGRMRALEVRDDDHDWFTLGEETTGPLDGLDVILMRKDPPFDMEYVYSTYLLELAEQGGSLVVNRPASLRDINEKLFTAWFPDCCAPTLVTRDPQRIRRFVAEQGDCIVKPLDAMGGSAVYRLREGGDNLNVILEHMTADARRSIMCQRFLPAVRQGDKRILLVDGEPVPYALARIPPADDIRANLAAGGRGQGVALSERDRAIAGRVGPELRRRGILFAGLDVIGEHLTEINVTSPTCARELDAEYGLDIGGQLMEAIARRRQPARTTP